MIKNYFMTAIRQLWKTRFYSLINVAGLSIGLASCFLIGLYVRHELSYDQFHKNKDRIYRIAETFKAGDGTMSTGLTPYKLAKDLKNHFAAIEKVVRIDYDIQNLTIKYNDKNFAEQPVTCSDPEFFHVFSFPLLAGDVSSVLKEPNTVAISDIQAKKYFGSENPMGKVLEFIDPASYKSFPAKVTGVFKAMPVNSHFHRDFIISMATADALIPERKDELGWTSMFSYLLLKKGTNPKQLEKAINDYVFATYPKNVTEWWSYFPLQCLTDIHLHSDLKEELEVNGDISYVYIFSAIASLIIILACINYMNLATARAANRAREVGIRRAVGAVKWQLVFQFIGESIIIAVLAFIVALAITWVSLPFFNNISGKNLSTDLVNARLLFLVTAFVISLGIAAGLYPAFFLSSFQPVKVLKSGLVKTGVHSLLLRKQAD